MTDLAWVECARALLLLFLVWGFAQAFYHWGRADGRRAERLKARERMLDK